jgi:hypothetical protein
MYPFLVGKSFFHTQIGLDFLSFYPVFFNLAASAQKYIHGLGRFPALVYGLNDRRWALHGVTGGKNFIFRCLIGIFG